MSPQALTSLAFLLGLTLVASALASALETALFLLREHQVRALGRKRPRLERVSRTLLQRPRSSLNQALVLSASLNLILAGLGLMLFLELRPLTEHALLMGLLLFAFLILFSDLLPTAVALASPALVVESTGALLLHLSPVLRPLSSRLIATTDWLTARLLPSRLQPRQGFSDTEIETLVEMRRDEGTLLPSESEIIQEILRLGDKTVKDCMTPRVDTFMIAKGEADHEVESAIRACGHWHIPIYEGSRDLVIGFLDVKARLQNPERALQDFVRPPIFVPETMPVLDAFRSYLQRPHAIAVVADEYGGVEGVIGHTDVIEELLGDTAPLPEPDAEIQRLAPDRLLTSGSARLEEIGEILDLPLDHKALSTIGGLVFTELGHLPEPGTRVVLRHLVVTVRQCYGNRITELLVERRHPRASSTDA